MCAIHHRAFDALVLGVTPKYGVEVREDVLDEKDGPTLLHALQGVQGQNWFSRREQFSGRTPNFSNSATRCSAKLDEHSSADLTISSPIGTVRECPTCRL